MDQSNKLIQEEEFEILPLSFQGKGHLSYAYFCQVKREGDVAIYSVNDGIHGYEVIWIKKREALSVLLGGKMVNYPAKEIYPSSEQFGVIAYSCSNLTRADKLFRELQIQSENSKVGIGNTRGPKRRK